MYNMLHKLTSNTNDVLRQIKWRRNPELGIQECGFIGKYHTCHVIRNIVYTRSTIQRTHYTSRHYIYSRIFTVFLQSDF